jgi:hypothetical protein
MRTKLTVLAAALLLVTVVAPANAEPPTLEEQIEASVVAGLEWLAAGQAPNGSYPGCEVVGRTGLVILKFIDRAQDLGLDPLSPDYEHHEVVQKGLDFIVARRIPTPIGVQPYGDPDSDGDGVGVYWGDPGCSGNHHQTYNTSIAAMVLAASGHPEEYLDPTFGDMLVDAVDFIAFGQGDHSWWRGGWGYNANDNFSDNSISGYATLALGYAQAAGIPIPQFVLDELDIWIGYIQNTSGGPNDGGSGYQSPTSWVNILKTGNLIYQMGLVGDTADTARVQDAVAYIERHWTDPGGSGTGTPGWLDHRQAMFAMMKGLEALGIDELDLGSGPEPWFPIVAQHLIDTQNPNGSWPRDPWDYQGPFALTAAWALLTLEKAVPVFDEPPECWAELVPIQVTETQGEFQVRYECTDDHEGLMVEADINGVPVEDGMMVDLIIFYDGQVVYEMLGGWIIKALEFLLTVHAVDSAGQEAWAYAEPVFENTYPDVGPPDAAVMPPGTPPPGAPPVTEWPPPPTVSLAPFLAAPEDCTAELTKMWGTWNQGTFRVDLSCQVDVATMEADINGYDVADGDMVELVKTWGTERAYDVFGIWRIEAPDFLLTLITTSPDGEWTATPDF